MNAKTIVRRVFDAFFLLVSAMLMLAGWAAWAAVEDTQSQKFGAFAVRDLALYMGLTGLLLLLIGVAFRFFSARWVSLFALILGIGLTADSLINYPSQADEPSYSYVFSPTREELWFPLLGGITLFLVIAWTGRKPRRSDT